MELVFGFRELEENSSSDAFFAESDPFGNYLLYPHDPRRACDKDIEIAGKTVLKRGEFEELFHQFFGVDPSFEVDGYFKTVKVGLVADIVYLGDLFQLRKLDDLFDYLLARRCRRYLGYVYAVV